MNKDIYEDSIILIGPSGAGKTTMANYFEKTLKMSRISLDKMELDARDLNLRDHFGTNEDFYYYLIKTAIDLALEHKNAYIIDFGANHSIYHDSKVLEEVKKLLRPFKNIVLLLPYKDKQKAITVMSDRSHGDTSNNAEFYDSLSNKELQTMTVYGEERSPKEIADEIFANIERRRNFEASGTL